MGVSGDGFWRPDVRAQFLTDDGVVVLMHYTGLVEQTSRFAEAAEADEATDWADQSPPECAYAPSRALADFVRCRDLTCRFPGCDRPAVACDLDHTIPHADGGPTHASNLKCLCRLHHLLKTFWGWRDKQLRDGTVIWTSPSGDTYVTTPGSALLFQGLCVPTRELAAPELRPPKMCADRTAMMPTRRRTRAQNRAHRIADERRQNRNDRLARSAGSVDYFGPAPPGHEDEDPPPF